MINRMKFLRLCLFVFLSIPLLGVCEFKVGGETASENFKHSLTAKLGLAAATGEVDKINKLVKLGADVNGIGLQSLTPLGWAMSTHNLIGLRTLLENGANPNQPTMPGTDYSPVWLAACMDNPNVLKVLLEFKADPNLLHDGGDFNALMVSVRNLEYLKLLVDAGADTNVYDRFGDTVGLRAARLAQYDAVMYLVSHGYTYNLPLLAWEVKNRTLSPELEPKRQQVLDLLKAMGVVPPEGKAPEMLVVQ